MNQTLHNDILSAYGTCDFIDSLLEGDCRLELGRELIRFVEQLGADRNQTEEFIRTYLLDPDALQPLLDESYSAGLFKAEGSRLMEDFIWADEYFQTVNPEFPSLNEKLLRSIFAGICRLYEKRPDWSDHWIHSGEHQDDGFEAPKQKGMPADRQDREKLARALERLDHLTGLESVKTEVRDLCALMEITRLRRSRNLKTAPVARHLVFSGNPGTGKTTTARILAEIYRELGFLSKGQLVECDRADLVGEYVGHSAQKTRKVIEKALGGILFIDEAYSLAVDSEKDFGRESIEILLKEMEDHREDLVVIAAGYPDLMEKFLSFNPGLRSRFTTFIHFENYTGGQLMQILKTMAEDLDYRLDENARKKADRYLEQTAKHPPRDFANARFVRGLLEKAISIQARRLFHQENINTEDLMTLTADDFQF